MSWIENAEETVIGSYNDGIKINSEQFVLMDRLIHDPLFRHEFLLEALYGRLFTELSAADDAGYLAAVEADDMVDDKVNGPYRQHMDNLHAASRMMRTTLAQFVVFGDEPPTRSRDALMELLNARAAKVKATYADDGVYECAEDVEEEDDEVVLTYDIDENGELFYGEELASDRDLWSERD